LNARGTEDGLGAAKRVAGLEELAPNYDAIVCDVWGVLIDGVRCHAEAARALEKFRAQGRPVILVTNASRPDEEVERQLAGLGTPADCYDDLVSAGELTLAAIVARAGQACHHLGPASDTGLFASAAERLGAPLRKVGIDVADYVVCTGLVDDEHERPEDYDRVLEAMLRRDLPMLCANPDVVVAVGDRLCYCAGALAERYARLGGRVEHFGKPHPPIYAEAQARLAAMRSGPIAPDRILAIGDGIATDLAGAARAGFDCLLITTGVHMDALHPGGGELDPAALDELLAGAPAEPQALARRLVW
jgi:HAD superfamily hydrolase (TIGR01459 family)